MPIYIPNDKSPAKNILFVHVPKCAGSFIEKLLANKFGAPLLFNKYQPPFMKVVPQHLTYQEVLDLNYETSDFDYAFTIVRNPYERVESEFFYQKRIYKIPHTPKDFSKWLLKSLKETKKDVYYMKSHFRPQIDFIAPGLKILKLENGMPKLIAILEKELGSLNPQEGKINAGDKTQVVWTQKALTKFNDFYSEDFREFGYVFNKSPQVKL
ncbi:sulfotransferase family 2 domain-containing protein [Rubritalea sp.]|uniref:sulfotransferase family 2 domain-containing protein n=1 Tax=Rubritalea sp. TaxID=2109375 RepID=UPI003EF6448C